MSRNRYGLNMLDKKVRLNFMSNDLLFTTVAFLMLFTAPTLLIVHKGNTADLPSTIVVDQSNAACRYQKDKGEKKRQYGAVSPHLTKVECV